MKALLVIEALPLLARIDALLSSHAIPFLNFDLDQSVDFFKENSGNFILITDNQAVLQRISKNLGSNKGIRTLIIVESDDSYDDDFLNIMELGVDGIIESQFSDRILIDAFHEIKEGMGYISPRFAKSLFDYFQINKTRASQLSDKELAVVKLLVKGETYMHIGEILNMSINTVRFHVKNIYKKHNIHNKTLLSRHFHDLVMDFPRASKSVLNEA